MYSFWLILIDSFEEYRIFSFTKGNSDDFDILPFNEKEILEKFDMLINMQL